MIWKKLAWKSVVASLFIMSSISYSCCAQPSSSTSNEDTYVVGGQNTSEQTYKAAEAVSEGLSLINNGQLDLALQKLQYAVQLDPNMPEAHHNLGYALTKLGRNNEAIAEYKKAIELHDNTESVWLSLGGLYQSSGQLDLAVQTLQEFLARFPSSTEYSKISSLVQGLKQEEHEQSLQGVSPQQAAASPDYFAAATAGGTSRWASRSMPLTVYIADGRYVPSYLPQFVDILRSAFIDWAATSNGLISFVFVNNPSEAAINCSWTNNPSDVSNAAEAGEAVIVKENGYIVRGTIKLLTVPLEPQLPLTSNRMKAFCLHEIGHALGIEGHSANPDDIMYSSAVLSDNPRTISVRDRNTLLRLYSLR